MKGLLLAGILNLRVLAAAMRTYDALPGDTSPAALEQHLCFLGLTGMIDPVRPEVVDAIRACRSAGIRPVMITGDHVDTAKAIARELGLLGPGDEAVTGTELSAMDDETFSSRLRHISVYARVQPEHKTHIVRAWRNAGFVTAMTGDGVNDAPSIRAADIGIVGKDILTESGADVYELLDTGMGKCRMCVAGPAGFTDDESRALRVATKFVNIARDHYERRGRDIDIVKLNGSIELAPILGLSDVIVDIVETGTTLKENDLTVIEEFMPISARFIANKASYKFKYAQLTELLNKMKEALAK